MFLNSIKEKQEAEERERKQIEGEEVKSFKEAVAARAVAEPPARPSSSTPTATKPPAASAVKKDKAKSLKGVVVKKKAKAPPTVAKPVEDKGKSKEESDLPDPKRRRIEES